MTVPTQTSGTFTAAELDEIAAQRDGLDADYYRRMAADQRLMGFTSTWMVLDPTDYATFKRYPVPPLTHDAVATRTAPAYAQRMRRMPTL